MFALSAPRPCSTRSCFWPVDIWFTTAPWKHRFGSRIRSNPTSKTTRTASLMGTRCDHIAQERSLPWTPMAPNSSRSLQCSSTWESSCHRLIRHTFSMLIRHRHRPHPAPVSTPLGSPARLVCRLRSSQRLEGLAHEVRTMGS